MPNPLFSSTARQQSIALAIVRVITGFTFMMHGYQKLFIFGVAGVQGAFTNMGAPMPMITGPFIGVLEFFGGIALIIGLLTRLAAFGLIFDMLGAIILVHFKNGYFAPGGVEFVLLLAVAALSLVVGGGGAFSVDDTIARRR